MSPLYYAYGNASEEILWAYARAKLLDRKLVIIAPARYTQVLGYTICNIDLFNLDFGYKFNFFELLLTYLVSFIINLVFFLSRLYAITVKKFFNIKLNERFFFPKIGRNLYFPIFNDTNGDLKKYEEDLILEVFQSIAPPTVNLNNKVSESLIFDELMVQVDSKFVCLHVRDSGFKNDAGRRYYRNADIDNYIPAIKMLIAEGFSVIRIGDKSMQKCNFTHDKFIQLFEMKSDVALLELLVVQHCEFYIGMQSGPYDLALLFQKPILLLNMYACFFWGPMKQIDRGLLKKIIIKDIGEVNSLSKRFNLPFRFNDISNVFKTEEVIFIENSPSEVLTATKLFYNDYLLGFSNESESIVSNRKLYKLSSKKVLEEYLLHSETHYDEFTFSRAIYHELSFKGSYYCNSSLKKEL